MRIQLLDPTPIWTPVSAGRAVPHRFVANIDDEGLDQLVTMLVRVDRDGAHVAELTVTRRMPAGSWITATDLRKVNVARFLRAAVDEAAEPRRVHDERHFTVESDPGFAYPLVGRGHGSSPERLAAVAETYRQAKRERTSTRRAVMRAFGVASSQAARLVRAARAGGYLEPRDEPSEPVEVGEQPDRLVDLSLIAGESDKAKKGRRR